MNNTAFITPTTGPGSDKLLAAVFVAIIIHISLILGVNFTTPEPKQVNKSIAITLVNTPSEKAPDKAKFLAQENQIGAGQKKQKATSPKQKIASRGKSQQAKKIMQAEAKKTSADKQVVELSTAMLSRQIAEIGINARDRQLNAENSRIKFIASVNAHKYKAAFYIQQWQTKVERVGNLNYPALARKQGFSGRLLMDVGINLDGSIFNIRIRKSSGYKALDDAATKIVRMAAPYAPLPKEWHAELDVLIITRVWSFSDETGMSAQ